MCFKKYEAHSFCKHPWTLTAPGDDWTQHIQIQPCNDAERAMKHARRPGEQVFCEQMAWVPEVNPLFPTFCASCEKTYAENGDRLWSATRIYGDFEVQRDKWEYSRCLDQAELQAIKDDWDAALRQYDAEASRGPYNNSYWTLRDALEDYTRRWDNYVKNKLAFQRQHAEQMEWEEAYRLARMSNTVEDAMETSIYAPGFSAQAEASSSQSHPAGHHSSSSHSHHGSSSGHSHKQSGWSQFFKGKRRH